MNCETDIDWDILSNETFLEKHVCLSIQVYVCVLYVNVLVHSVCFVPSVEKSVTQQTASSTAHCFSHVTAWQDVIVLS